MDYRLRLLSNFQNDFSFQELNSNESTPCLTYFLAYKETSCLFYHLRDEENKSGLSRLNSSYSANSRPIYMYYIPNQWKFNEDFAELCRFEIAALIEA